MEKQRLRLTAFAEKDILSLIQLSQSVGWDYDEKEIRTVLRSGKIFGHKNSKEQIVSSAAIKNYDSHLASIGMVIVHEKYRGIGLGKEVTQKCIDSVSSQTAIMLIATAEGKPLYERMGFKAVDHVHKFVCDKNIQKPSPVSNAINIVSFTWDYFNRLVNLDEKAFGVKRSHFLEKRIAQAEKCLAAVDINGEIIGYGLSIPGPINLLLGPIAAPNAKIGLALIDQLISNYRGKLRIDVPSGHKEFMSLLEERGFIKINQPPIMIYNSDVLPERNQTMYGIAAQIFG